jgi:Mg2+-importing ATPase
VFVIRTHASPFWRGRPSPALIASALIGVAAAILLPYTPLAAPLGLTAWRCFSAVRTSIFASARD